MKPTSTIFAAHDFSKPSKNALNIAAELALKTQSTLFVYHVLSSAAITDNVNLVNFSADISLNRAMGALKRSVLALKKQFPSLQIEFDLGSGFLVTTISDKIKEINPWISVLGVKKRTGFDKMIFGDVCSVLVDKVEVPMLVIPNNYKDLKLDKLSYAWDGDTLETSQLKPLNTLLGDHKSTLLVLNVTHYDDTVLKKSNTFKSALQKMFKSQSVEIKHVMGLDAIKTMEEALLEIQPDLLVVYKHHESFWQRLFHKSFSKKAIQFSHSPVLVLK
jgi:nucleotide-binding universal stress UspA family protein